LAYSTYCDTNQESHLSACWFKTTASAAGGDKTKSVDELLEEGNAFEAEAVKGVQDAPDADESEVVAHEVPEDDVPEEYLDKDQ
jgi:hypothetical protein